MLTHLSPRKLVLKGIPEDEEAPSLESWGVLPATSALTPGHSQDWPEQDQAWLGCLQGASALSHRQEALGSNRHTKRHLGQETA